MFLPLCLLLLSSLGWSAASTRAQAPRAGPDSDVVLESVGADTVVVRWASTTEEEGAADLIVWFGEVEPDAFCAVADQPPLLGTVETDADHLIFRPRLPLRAGRPYTVCLATRSESTDAASSARWSGRFTLDSNPVDDAGRAPRVVEVWPPPGESIPANSLRFYVQFDQPMRAAAVDRGVELIDQTGAPIRDAVVPIPEGLWDARRQRLTVTLHPGRIKRGVGPREKQGPARVPGSMVRLRMGEELRSESGVPMMPVVFLFPVGPDDRSPPKPEAWRVVAPTRSDAPMVLELDERLDPWILRRAIRLLEVKGEERLPRKIDLEVEEAGRRILVRPTSGRWRVGSFRLEVLGIVEDLAGNRPGRPFDSPLDREGPVGGAQREPVWVGFDVEVAALDGSG